jgi:DNA end-binding protein Ku
MPSSSWKGFISFGLISVPIRLFPAARSAHIRFHEVHRECGTRVRQQLYCPHDERVVTRDELALGYEIDEDKFVLVDPKELKSIEPASSQAMEIVQFVKLGEVDPIYFETSYFSVPEKAGEKAYSLLLETMEEMNFAAIARVTMHRRESTVILRPYRHGLVLHTLYYPDEIRETAGYGKNATKELRKEEVRLGEQFAKGLLKAFDPEKFHDGYQERVQELIESKTKGGIAPRGERQKKLAPVIDLMTALKQSIASGRRASESPAKKRVLRKSA